LIADPFRFGVNERRKTKRVKDLPQSGDRVL